MRSSIGLGSVDVLSFSMESSAATILRMLAIESRTSAGDSFGDGGALPRKSQVTRWNPAAPGPLSVRSVSPDAS